MGRPYPKDVTYRIEDWRDIPGWEGFYQVSSTGLVRSLTRTLTRKNGVPMKSIGRILAARNCNRGYWTVTLSRNGVQPDFLVHRLVALAFIGPCPDGLEVAHNDGDKNNNAPSNLRYATAASNQHDQVIHGKTTQGEKSHFAKLTETKVLAIREDHRFQRIIAMDYGVAQTLISQIKRRKVWSHI